MKWYLGIDIDNVGTYYIVDANHCIATKEEAKPFASVDEAEEYARKNNIPLYEDIVSVDETIDTRHSFSVFC